MNRTLDVWRSTALMCGMFFLASARPVHAGINVWTGNGPAGGDIKSLAIDPHTPSVLYAGTDSAGVFESTNGGDSWAAVNTGLPNSTTVTSLAVDPISTLTVYAGTWSGVFKSTTGGTIWQKSGTSEMTGRVIALAIDPLTPTTLYAGTDCLYFNCGVDTAHIFRSTDSGAHWEESDSGIVGRSIVALVVDPVSPAIVYAGTESGVFKSTDSAATWTAISSGLPPPDPEFFWVLSSLVIDPKDDTRLYTAIGGNTFETTDSGASWNALNTDFRPPSLSVLAINPANPEIIYAGSNYSYLLGVPGPALYKSTNGGEEWEAVGLAGQVVHTLVIDPLTPTTIYAGTGINGVFKSTDAGATWNVKLSGMTNSFVEAVAVDPVTPSVVYAASYGGLFRSSDGGASWIGSAPPSGFASVSVLVVDPVTPGTVYAAGAGVFKSTDSGGGWSSLGLEKESVEMLLVDPTEPDVLYATGSDAFKSTDGGMSWTTLGIRASVGSSFNNVQSLALDPTRPANLFAAVVYCGADPSHPDGCTALSSLFKSTDGGASWTATALADVGFVAVAPTTPVTIYAGGSGLFRSTDGGMSWTSIQTGLKYGVINALLVAPDAPTTLYAAGNGVAKSTDSGDTWHLMDDGLTRPVVNALAISPADPMLIYAGTDGGGVFALQQVSLCIGDCSADGHVTVDELLMLVNIALGNGGACLSGLAAGVTPDVSVILQAVNNALNGCGG